jgi:hypothetical protein
MSFYTVFARPPRRTYAAFSYGMLGVILVLLAIDLQWRLSLPSAYPHDRNLNCVVVLMLLFNHLAYQFRWPPAATVGLRVLAWSWLVFGVFCIVFCLRIH